MFSGTIKCWALCCLNPLWLHTGGTPFKTTSCQFFYQMIGFYPYKKGVVCEHNLLKNRKYLSFQSNLISKTFDSKPFLTRTSKNVVYIITCLCGRHYVGHTVRTFQVKMKKHIANIRRSFPNHSLSKNYDLCHRRSLKVTSSWQ